ncbi:YqaA family protein [Marinicellulosiphila megalodicopiae]|uniref:YqaA family protein n=1 Tax=Marinicellulosiphila megalodicopiae TaxID=2724896 RepID=UPI003BB0DD34
MDVLYLFIHSLIASTIIPISSEIGLAALVHQFPHNAVIYLIFATIGNTLGSIISYYCGRLLTKWQTINAYSNSQTKLMALLKRYGVWVLLFAWLPIIGDFLCVGAGVLRLNIWLSSLLILIGKSLRYCLVIVLVI